MVAGQRDDWAELDALAAAAGLGIRQQGWQQRLGWWPHALIVALACAVAAPLYALWKNDGFMLGELAVLAVGSWLVIMAVLIFVQSNSIRRRQLRVAQYQGGVVVADAGQLHVAHWDELSVSADRGLPIQKVTLVFRTPLGSSVVAFGSGEWPEAGRVGRQLAQQVRSAG